MSLIEVLAAVALLGLIYTALAGKATQGVMAEGDSRRRLEAELVADRVLAEMETQMSLGSTEPVGTREEEDGLFRVTIEVVPWTPPLPEDTTPARGGADGAATNRTAGPDLLTGTRNGDALLHQVTVRVAWSDGIGERSIERTTFALDYDLLGAFAAPPEDQETGS